MNLSALEARLQEMQTRWEEAIKSDAPLEKRLAAKEGVLQAERALSLAKGEETALSCEWEIPWNTGAPLPHVVASGMSTYLMYIANEPDPNWDGSYVTEVRTSDPHSIALVEFIDCYAFQFGGPNDEVANGHRLWGRGLEFYSAHVVANSRWLAEMEKINMAHPGYLPAQWSALKHYLLFFHDDFYECLAKGYTIEVLQDSLEHVVEIARTRLFARTRGIDLPPQVMHISKL